MERIPTQRVCVEGAEEGCEFGFGRLDGGSSIGHDPWLDRDSAGTHLELESKSRTCPVLYPQRSWKRRGCLWLTIGSWTGQIGLAVLAVFWPEMVGRQPPATVGISLAIAPVRERLVLTDCLDAKDSKRNTTLRSLVRCVSTMRSTMVPLAGHRRRDPARAGDKPERYYERIAYAVKVHLELFVGCCQCDARESDSLML